MFLMHPSPATISRLIFKGKKKKKPRTKKQAVKHNPLNSYHSTLTDVELQKQRALLGFASADRAQSVPSLTCAKCSARERC